MFLRQATSQAVRFGPFLDSTDAVTPETALTIAQADMQLSKDGAAFAQKNATGNATHDTDGWYSTTLDATDTDTVGELILQVNVTGAGPVWVRWYVVEEAVYDALYASGAAMLSSTTMNAIADHVLRRSLASARASSDGDSVGFRSILGAASKLVNRVGVSGTDLITYQEDDSTSFGTQAITTNANADPITDLDTA